MTRVMDHTVIKTQSFLCKPPYSLYGQFKKGSNQTAKPLEDNDRPNSKNNYKLTHPLHIPGHNMNLCKFIQVQ